MNSDDAVAFASFALLGIPLIGFALWLKTRPYRNGDFGRLWGMADEDEYRAELEHLFPGSTKPLPAPRQLPRTTIARRRRRRHPAKHG
jgi:hypothetical protein